MDGTTTVAADILRPPHSRHPTAQALISGGGVESMNAMNSPRTRRGSIEDGEGEDICFMDDEVR